MAEQITYRDDLPHVARGRAAKAGKVADLLDATYGPSAALGALQTASEDDWDRWAQSADVGSLSIRTRALVVASLERRADPPADPFAGLQMVWPRRDRKREGEAEILACRVVAERLRLHAAGLRIGTAVLRAKLAETDRERLAWECQILLAATDADRHGLNAAAAAIRLAELENR